MMTPTITSLDINFFLNQALRYSTTEAVGTAIFNPTYSKKFVSSDVMVGVIVSEGHVNFSVLPIIQW